MAVRTGWEATGTYWVADWEAAAHPTAHRMASKAHNSNGAKPCFVTPGHLSMSAGIPPSAPRFLSMPQTAPKQFTYKAILIFLGSQDPGGFFVIFLILAAGAKGRPGIPAATPSPCGFQWVPALRQLLSWGSGLWVVGK